MAATHPGAIAEGEIAGAVPTTLKGFGLRPTRRVRRRNVWRQQ